MPGWVYICVTVTTGVDLVSFLVPSPPACNSHCSQLLKGSAKKRDAEAVCTGGRTPRVTNAQYLIVLPPPGFKSCNIPSGRVYRV